MTQSQTPEAGPVYTRIVTVTLTFPVTDAVTEHDIADLAVRAGVQVEEPYVTPADPERFDDDYLGDAVGPLTITTTVTQSQTPEETS